MGTNTSAIEVRPHRDGARASMSGDNAQTSLPIVAVMLPSGGGDTSFFLIILIVLKMVKFYCVIEFHILKVSG